MVSRAGTRRCYISLLCVGVGVKKQRKISSESERERLRKICASSRTPPSPPRTTEFEEKDSREMRALLLCVAVHKIALLLYIKGKKAPSPLPKRKRTYDAKANAQHHQTQSLKRYTTKERSRGYSSRKRTPERETRSPHSTVVFKEEQQFYLFFTKKSKKGRGETCLFLIVLHAFRKVYHIH